MRHKMDKKNILEKIKVILSNRQTKNIETDYLAIRQTDFPQTGDDKKISLRNSEYNLFPVDEAQDLKDNWMSIWREGGNVRGNKQFELLAPIARRGGNTESVAEENAVKRREAWAARHYKDYQLAGVVAQIKWLVVGSEGLDHMRAVIREAKDKLKQKSMEQRVEPLPGQDKETFLAYCMDSAIMTNEYPDTAQRYAVCQSYWSNKTE
jgi:hypothetical protein